MIGTIGFLVKEARSKWLIASSIYIAACTGTAAFLGMLLSSIGSIIKGMITGPSSDNLFVKIGSIIVAIVALSYAFSDIGVFRLPRPRLMHGVPATWWRWWRPYGASLAYGAALGIGVTTEIRFGAFYVLCLWCAVQGNVLYGALLMGTYGIARSLAMLPMSWIVHEHCTDGLRALGSLSNLLGTAKLIMAIMLILFGLFVLSFVLF